MSPGGNGSEDSGQGLLATGAFATYRRLLRNRNYRRWFMSSLGSALGDWVGIFALQILVVEIAEPGSRVALFGLGAIMIARLLPSVMFGPLSGVAADRYDRKRLMVATDMARAALFVGIAFSRNLALLFTLTFAVECLSLVYMAAKDASLPVIVQKSELTHANQMNLMATYGPLPFGAVAGSAMVVIASWLEDAGLPSMNPVVLALLINAATFLIAGLIIARLEIPKGGRKAREDDRDGVLDELKEGLSYIRNFPIIRSLIIGVVGVFFGAGVVVTLGPAFVRSSLGRSETDWFGLMTAFGTGLLVGLLSAPFARLRVRNEVLFPVALTVAALVAAVTALLPRFDLAMLMGGILGIAAGLSFVTGYTMLHEHSRDEIRARTFAAFYTATRISMFFALAMAPFIAGAIGESEIAIGGWNVTLSGIRMTIFFGGMVALASTLIAGKGLFKEIRSGSQR